jgi:hypothetical protein
MNTSHLRRLAALLSDGTDCGETAAEYLEDAAAEIDRLQTTRKLIAQTEIGERWHWQGDGHDFPDSLVCPVIIDPGALRDLLRDAGRLPWNPVTLDPIQTARKLIAGYRAWDPDVRILGVRAGDAAAALTCLLPECHLMGLSSGNEVTI